MPCCTQNVTLCLDILHSTRRLSCANSLFVALTLPIFLSHKPVLQIPPRFKAVNLAALRTLSTCPSKLPRRPALVCASCVTERWWRSVEHGPTVHSVTKTGQRATYTRSAGSSCAEGRADATRTDILVTFLSIRDTHHLPLEHCLLSLCCCMVRVARAIEQLGMSMLCSACTGTRPLTQPVSDSTVHSSPSQVPRTHADAARPSPPTSSAASLCHPPLVRELRQHSNGIR